MAKTTKNILSLNHEEVMDFFMKSEQYHGFELPEYFTFDEVKHFILAGTANISHRSKIDISFMKG